jgi:hypothetical protein
LSFGAALDSSLASNRHPARPLVLTYERAKTDAAGHRSDRRSTISLEVRMDCVSRDGWRDLASDHKSTIAATWRLIFRKTSPSKYERMSDPVALAVYGALTLAFFVLLFLVLLAV